MKSFSQSSLFLVTALVAVLSMPLAMAAGGDLAVTAWAPTAGLFPYSTDGEAFALSPSPTSEATGLATLTHWWSWQATEPLPAETVSAMVPDRRGGWQLRIVFWLADGVSTGYVLLPIIPTPSLVFSASPIFAGMANEDWWGGKHVQFRVRP